MSIELICTAHNYSIYKNLRTFWRTSKCYGWSFIRYFDAGVRVTNIARSKRAEGTLFEFRDPDNHSLEIFWGLDQIGTNSHARPPEEWREELSLKGAVANAPVGQDTTLADPSLLDND